MKKECLSQTNPYLRDNTRRLTGLVASVRSSSAIEGIAAAALIEAYLIKKGNPPKPHKPVMND
jgi:hypothetical protein